MSLAYKLNSFQPQALSTGLYSRISKDPENALIINNAPQGRTAKRNAQQINYAELDNIDDFEFEDAPTTNTASSTALATTLSTQPTSAMPKHLLKPAKYVQPLNFTEDDHVKQIEATPKSDEVLIPIRLELEYNSGMTKLIDFFMWNLNETLVTPEQFASTLCSDLELPNSLHQEIVDSINKQIEVYSYISTLQLPPNNEYHVVIDLAVNLEKKLYQDKFEWDLCQTDITPEAFAGIVVADMGLSLEFKPAIAHSLHEVILRLKKEIADGTYNYELHKYQQLSGLIFENGIRIRTESSVSNGNDNWEPVVEVLSSWEIEKREIERERNVRRLKRENMRREVDDYSSNKRRYLGRRKFEEFDAGWKH